MYGKIVLPNVFSDNMVLQQNSEVAIWGWSKPSETVKIVVSWNSSDTIKVTANNATKWKTTIKTIQAGGPYTIQIIGDRGVELKNVMLGEVWLCSGQSNMEMNVDWGIFNGEEEAAKANYPNIRIFNVPKIAADYPQQDCRGSWTKCTLQTMRSTSSVGYFFARELQKKLNTPIGIIVSAWGGTPAEVWLDKNIIEKDSVMKKSATELKEYIWGPNKPQVAFNGMISPIVPYKIAGVVWYQGEGNTETPSSYDRLLSSLIGFWRTQFETNFPFYFVQIAPFSYNKNVNAAIVREKQTQCLNLPKTGMVLVNDLVDDVKDIHPKNKQDVGIRLAKMALSETYKQNVGAYKSPQYQSMRIEKGKVIVSFSDVLTGLKCTGKTPERFLIAGEDQKFVSAKAEIKGNMVILSSKEVKNPVAVRFCFDNTSMPDIFSNEGFPLAPFRTDKW